MITISKGKESKVVSKGAFESFYKPLGYEISGSKVSFTNVEPKVVKDEVEKKEYETKSDKFKKKDSSK